MDRPGVGIALFVRKEGKILIGKRLSEHGNGFWGLPGGKLDLNEDPAACAIRETREETGLEISSPRFITFTNDVFVEAGKHWITLFYVVDWKSGEAKTMEPEKCETWEWFDRGKLPQPLFLPLANFVALGIDPLTFS